MPHTVQSVSKSEPSPFRPLNLHEKAVIVNAVEKGRVPPYNHLYTNRDYLRVNYEQMQGGFCICLVMLEIESLGYRILWKGASRRSYKDPRKPIKGQMLAFSRAVNCSRPIALLD